MSDLSLQKRLAAEVLGVGVSRVRFDVNRVDDIADAMTREDIRRLIKDGAIWAEPAKGNSSERTKKARQQRKKGRRRGQGSRKGSKGARQDEKEAWMNRIRKIRRYLKYLREHGMIDRRTYRRLYMLAKGGRFHSLASLRTFLVEQGIMKPQARR
ncbi:MAG: 50S ribosomal protein L19e [Desulfurococcaceae archaeon]